MKIPTSGSVATAVIALLFLLGGGIVVFLLSQNRLSFNSRASSTETESLQEKILQGKAVKKKLGVIIFNPKLKSKGQKTLVEYKNWNDPDQMTEALIKDFQEVSGGYLNYEVSYRREVNDFEKKTDGFRYDEKTLLAALNDPTKAHSPNEIDYPWLISAYKLCDLFNRGKVEEIWLWGHPLSGYEEAVIMGPGAFPIFGSTDPIIGTDCKGKLILMGFNYERGLGMALESYGHRVEATMRHVFGGSWAYKYGPPPANNPANPTPWDRFTKRGFDPELPSGCGNIHGGLNTLEYDPNNFYNYDWTNTATVRSYCEDFLTYPAVGSEIKNISCEAWADCSPCTPFSPERGTCRNKWLDYGYAFKKWWLSHLPRANYFTSGIANNWWAYIANYDKTIKTKVEATTCRLEYYEDNSKNIPGKYYLENKITTAGPGQTIVLYAGVVNIGTITTNVSLVDNRLATDLTAIDGDSHCSKTNQGYTCRGYRITPGQTSGGAYRVKLSPALVPGTIIDGRLIVYKDSVVDELCATAQLKIN